MVLRAASSPGFFHDKTNKDWPSSWKETPILIAFLAFFPGFSRGAVHLVVGENFAYNS